MTPGANPQATPPQATASGITCATQRTSLVRSPRTIFQRDSQRSDLLDPNMTSSGLIVALQWLVLARGYILEFTAIRTDHHDDSALGPFAHWQARAVDFWTLNSCNAGDYVDPTTHAFRQFLVDLYRAPGHAQTGLAGSANTEACRRAAGPNYFPDSGADHVHFGVR